MHSANEKISQSRKQREHGENKAKEFSKTCAASVESQERKRSGGNCKLKGQRLYRGSYLTHKHPSMQQCCCLNNQTITSSVQTKQVSAVKSYFLQINTSAVWNRFPHIPVRRWAHMIWLLWANYLNGASLDSHFSSQLYQIMWSGFNSAHSFHFIRYI